MNLFSTKRILIIIPIIISGFLIFYLLQKNTEEPIIDISNQITKHSIIGLSVEERKIEAYTYGNGDKHIVFIGGIHGGYEWNSVLLAYEFIDYFNEHSEIIPEDITITIIPSANPDGIYKIIKKEGSFNITDIPTDIDTSIGRFNANKVDLNRNFDCKWKAESTWRNNPVSAGSAPFSEPEAQTIQKFILEKTPVAVIFWHSQSNSVYASECEDGVLPETLDIMKEYSDASGYTPIESFDSYEITGDAEGWLASIGIPAITVELKTHESIDWNQNLSGVKAILQYYKK